jgi:hypothetical protein
MWFLACILQAGEPFSPVTVFPVSEGHFLSLLQDARLTPALVEEGWPYGGVPFEAGPQWAVFEKTPLQSARLRLSGPEGVLLEEDLKRPFARLEPSPISGVEGWLLTVDWYAGVGSYNGPISSLFWVQDKQLKWAEVEREGKRTRLEMLSSLKSAWKVDAGPEPDQLLYVACQPTEADFSSSIVAIAGMGRYGESKRGGKQASGRMRESFPQRAGFLKKNRIESKGRSKTCS